MQIKLLFFFREFNLEVKTSGRKTKNSYAATLTSDRIKTNHDPSWYLSDCLNNIHEFTAMSNTVVFDVLLPPYLEPNRPCNYYKYSISSKNLSDITVGTQVNLVEVDEPTDLLPYAVKYSGFKPVLKDSVK